MEEWIEYVAYYPSIVVHPLKNERDILKRKYVALLRKYADRFDNNKTIEVTKGVLCKSLGCEMEESEGRSIDLQSAERMVLKTRFSPFKFFSYRYVFLFDCLMFFAVNDKEKGMAICEELKKAVHRRYYKKIDEMVRLMYEENSSFSTNTLITEEMVNAWNYARKYTKTVDKSAIFTATMSAGKSTLINAIVGNDLSRVKKAACTSKIIKVHSMPSRNELCVVAVQDTWCYLRNVEEAQKYIWENENDTEIAVYFHSQLNCGRYTLIDTPGVNSSLNPEHKKIARHALEGGVETIVYVIPVDTYGAEDDYNHLLYIHKKVNYERIIFAVNMMDTIDPEDDSIEEILSDIKEHLEQIGFRDPIVYPVSAEAGLRLKRMLSGLKMSENEIKSCKNYIKLFLRRDYALGGYYPIITEKGKNMNNWICEEYDEQLWRAYINTGLPGLEKILFNE